MHHLITFFIDTILQHIPLIKIYQSFIVLFILLANPILLIYIINDIFSTIFNKLSYSYDKISFKEDFLWKII